MGLKGYRLWVMGKLARFNLQRPTAHRPNTRSQPPARGVAGTGRPRGVALQVAFERQTLKPVFHLIGYRLWV
jgi:hypothetical protein